MSPARARTVDVVGAVMVVGVALAWLFWRAVFDTPQEDAAILLRYARNLGEGHGVVWNVGAAPVEGATDFLFMLQVAALVAAGISSLQAAWVLGVAAHVATVLVVYWRVRASAGASGIVVAVAAAAFVAFGPAWIHICHAFGATIFAFWLALAWSLLVRATAAPQSTRRALVFAVTALAAALTRPEGVMITPLLLAGAGVAYGAHAVKRAAIAAFIVFATLGGAYFVWRWRYFGELLPVPFLRKGGGSLYSHSLWWSLERIAWMIWPWLAIAVIAALVAPSRRRELVGAVIPVVGFAVVWVLVSDAQNVGWRFQYPIVPLAVIAFAAPSAAALTARFGSQVPRLGAVAIAVVASFGATIHWRSLDGKQIGSEPMVVSLGGGGGTRAVAGLLSMFGGGSYTIATSEAGVLPFFSRWRTLDTWGLNDPDVARHGIDEKRLDTERPHVLLVEAHDFPYLPEVDADWSEMNRRVIRWARSRGYQLAAVFGPGRHFVHVYYVRPDFPESVLIASAIRNVRYEYWGECKDWAPAIRSGRPLGPLLDSLR